MRLVHLSVAGYGPVAEAKIDFSPSFNVIVGRNGAGKTWILDFLSGIAGTDDAMALLRDRTCESVVLVADDEEGNRHGISLSGKLRDCQAKIEDFKRKFRHRVSYGVTEEGYRIHYHSELIRKLVPKCDNYDTPRWRDFLASLDMSLDYMTDDDLERKCVAGDGAKQVVRLCNSLINMNNPILWDSPERSLHILVGRSMPRLTKGFQMILATHAPEFVANKEDGAMICSLS